MVAQRDDPGDDRGILGPVRDHRGTFHVLEWVRISGDMVFLLLGALPILMATVRSITRRDAPHE
jgi:nitric oxide reductase large subunit